MSKDTEELIAKRLQGSLYIVKATTSTVPRVQCLGGGGGGSVSAAMAELHCLLKFNVQLFISE